MESVRDLLRDCQLEAVAHRQDLRKASSSTSFADSVKILREAEILSIPVIDKGTNQFAGCFSVNDILRAIVKELHLERAEDIFDKQTATTRLEKLFSNPVSSVMHNGELWYMEGHTLSVLDAVKEMVKHANVHHRVFTCDTLKRTQPSGVLCQSDVVRVLWEHRVELHPLLSMTVQDLQIAEAAAECVQASDPLMHVLAAMFRDRKSCMGVMHEGELVGNLSVSDLRHFSPSHASLLTQPVAEYIVAVHFPSTYKDGSVGDWEAVLKRLTVHSVTPVATLKEVLEVLATRHVHRVYVRDSEEATIRIITLTDILRLVLPQELHAPPSMGPAGGLPHSCELPVLDGVEGVEAQASVVAH